MSTAEQERRYPNAVQDDLTKVWDRAYPKLSAEERLSLLRQIRQSVRVIRPWLDTLMSRSYEIRQAMVEIDAMTDRLANYDPQRPQSQSQHPLKSLWKACEYLDQAATENDLREMKGKSWQQEIAKAISGSWVPRMIDWAVADLLYKKHASRRSNKPQTPKEFQGELQAELLEGASIFDPRAAFQTHFLIPNVKVDFADQATAIQTAFLGVMGNLEPESFWRSVQSSRTEQYLADYTIAYLQDLAIELPKSGADLAALCAEHLKKTIENLTTKSLEPAAARSRLWVLKQLLVERLTGGAD